jgi:hypothetical protein
MTTKTFYEIALTTPLWLPILIKPLAHFDALVGLVELFTFSLIYGGIPYLVFLGGVYLNFRRQNGQRLRDASVLFPIIFTGVLLLGLTILGIINFKWVGILITMAVCFVLLGLAFGYAYVALIALIYRLLRRTEFISDFNTNEPQTIRLELR